MNQQQLSIALFAATPEQQKVADELSHRLNLTVVTHMDTCYAAYVVCDENGIGLSISQLAPMKPLQVDFASEAFTWRRKSHGKNQPIAKAIGIKPNYYPTVIDITAGLGRDSFLLAELGCPVTLVERNPVIFTLLNDGVQRASLQQELAVVIARMQCVQQEGIDYLQSLSFEQKPDVIYLDPMFPSRQKTALVKKEMQVLHYLLHDEEFSDNLLTTALQFAKKRVVVKRPLHAPLLEDIKPHHMIKTPQMRFDVYIINSN